MPSADASYVAVRWRHAGRHKLCPADVFREGMRSALAQRVPVPAQVRTPDDREDLRGLGTIDLVGGILDDTRDLVAGHVDLLRDDISQRLHALGATLSSLVVAIGLYVVTAILLGLAIVASLVAVGVPAWLALWLVTVISGAIATRYALRTRDNARATAHPDASATGD